MHGIGAALLAHLPQEERERYLAEHEGYQAADAEERQRIVSELDTIVRQGYSYKENEIHMGIRDIAVLAGNPKAGLAAAVAVPSLIVSGRQLAIDLLRKELASCALEITKAMGLSCASEQG